jgi:hypothetical protein
MKIVIIRENEAEEIVDLDFSFSNGTLKINFPLDFLGKKLKIEDGGKTVFKSYFLLK